MKVVRLPTKAGGQWWVVVHGMTLENSRLQHFRPIHAFTLLAQNLVRNKKNMYRLCMALENKLFAVRHHAFELRRAISSVGDPIYPGHFVRSYDPDQVLIAALEAYLNALYSVLEVAAKLNRLLRPTLPQSFRKQSKRFSLFSFTTHKWLPRFLDVRSELSHFSTPLPLVSEGKLIINFQNSRDLEVFTAGGHEIPLIEFLQYAPNLFDMLDRWALSELGNVDPEAEIDSIRETGPTTPLEASKIKAAEILRLVRGLSLLQAEAYESAEGRQRDG
jgi:hypothetical protein